MEDAQALEVAARTAFRAGRVALARVGDPGYLSWKGQRDVVSGAILEVQNVIVEALRRECPGDAILAEEGPEDEALAVDAERLWVVDPICGSLNFSRGIPFFAISLALRVEGTLRVGVVYDPVRDETFAARAGEQATLNGKPISVLAIALGPEFWEQAAVATDLPHSGPRREEALRIFTAHSHEVLSLSVLGSPALALAYVACGRLHAYWNVDARPWDVAAGAVIVQQAGGLVTDADAGSWLHSDGSYVAANPASHQWALRAIKMIREQGRPQHFEQAPGRSA